MNFKIIRFFLSYFRRESTTIHKWMLKKRCCLLCGERIVHITYILVFNIKYDRIIMRLYDDRIAFVLLHAINDGRVAVHFLFIYSSRSFFIWHSIFVCLLIIIMQKFKYTSFAVCVHSIRDALKLKIKNAEYQVFVVAGWLEKTAITLQKRNEIHCGSLGAVPFFIACPVPTARKNRQKQIRSRGFFFSLSVSS